MSNNIAPGETLRRRSTIQPLVEVSNIYAAKLFDAYRVGIVLNLTRRVLPYAILFVAVGDLIEL